LTERLLNDGATVTVLDNFSTGRRENLAKLDSSGLTVIDGSITDGAALDRALEYTAPDTDITICDAEAEALIRDGWTP